MGSQHGEVPKHKIGDLVYSKRTGLGIIRKIELENIEYPYVIEWNDERVKHYITIPSFHNSQEIEYFKTELVSHIQSREAIYATKA